MITCTKIQPPLYLYEPPDYAIDPDIHRENVIVSPPQ